MKVLSDDVRRTDARTEGRASDAAPDDASPPYFLAAKPPEIHPACAFSMLASTQLPDPPTFVHRDEEIPLEGGRLTKGVVRVGDTVRRPGGQGSHFVAALLRHLEALGVTWAPRYLGQDENGRDVLTYMPGRVPLRWGYFSDEQVFGAGRLLRDFHDATRSSVLAGQAEVVCHNDFGPSNAVFIAERPVAMIDFDTAAPGEPLEDVGYTVWAWCISSRAHRPPIHEQARQVRVLVDAYGDLAVASRRAVVDAVLERQERNARFWTDALNKPDQVATPLANIPAIIEWSRNEAVFVRTNRQQFEGALR